MPRKKTHQEYLDDLLKRGIEFFPLEEYVKSSAPIKHTCKQKHIWNVAPNNILNGRGCPECSKSKRTKTLASYNEELKSLNIEYLAIEPYISSNVPILHKCQVGHEWKARPNGILSARNGCPKCSINRMKTTHEYIRELLVAGMEHEVLEEYKGARVPILHSCVCGTSWKATPDNILRGTGCPSCASYGFDPTKPAILYYIKITCYPKEVYYKIGITNRSIVDRFSRDKDKDIKVLLQKEFSIGADAHKEERRILSKYSASRITVPKFLKSNGNTELFDIDILGLDT